MITSAVVLLCVSIIAAVAVVWIRLSLGDNTPGNAIRMHATVADVIRRFIDSAPEKMAYYDRNQILRDNEVIHAVDDAD